MVDLSYTSVKYLRVHSTRLALLHYALLLGIAAYVVFAQIIQERGYQAFDDLVATVRVRVTGAATLDGLVYDAADVVQPPLESNDLFLTTALRVTHNQRRGECAGSDRGTELCSLGCVANRTTLNGVETGVCAPNSKFCIVRGWCPQERAAPRAASSSEHMWLSRLSAPRVAPRHSWLRAHSHRRWRAHSALSSSSSSSSTSSPSSIAAVASTGTAAVDPVLHNVATWKVDVLASLRFPHFDASRVVRFSKSVDELLRLAGTSFDASGRLGAIILVTMSVRCNLDRASSSSPPPSSSSSSPSDVHTDDPNCAVETQFVRVDSEEAGAFFSGFNYAYVVRRADSQEAQEVRDLYRVYGVRFVFHVNGVAGRFDLDTLTFNIGTAIGLLSVAQLLTDALMERIVPKRLAVALRRRRVQEVNVDRSDARDTLLLAQS